MLYELLSEELERYPDRNSVQTSVVLKDVGNVINDLTVWSFKPLYLQETFTDDVDRFSNPSRELFIWAVLQGRLEMAILFWQKSKAPIGGALVASKLLKEMAARETDLHETRRLTRYEEGGRLFDKLAVEVLSEYYTSDRKLTTLTLVRVLHTWGSAICLDLANTAHNMEFVAHPAVQNMLKEFWMGNLSVSNPRWKIWICLVFPPALLCIRLKMKEEEVDPLVVKRLPRGRHRGDIKLRRPQLMRRPTFSIRRSVLSLLPGLPHRSDETDGETSSPNFTGLPLSEMNRQKRIWFAEHDNEKPRASLRRRVSSFFFVPNVIFLYNVFSKLVFLGLFSYILLQGFESKYPSEIEYVLLAWFFTLCIELIRQVLWEVGPTFLYRLSIWIHYFWNKVDICKIVVFITGYVLRCFPDTMSEGRILLALSLVIFYIRLLHVFSANKHLGPKLVMIEGMFADLLVFVSILLVFLTCYGVASEAILYPGRSGVSNVLESIFFRPYLQIFGELLEANGEECYTYTREVGNATHTAIEETCQQNAWFGTILLSIYLFLSNVLLLNLLIAMFNFTFVAVQEKTDIHWKWQRFKLITEYHKRPVLAPPFIIISHIILFVRRLFKKLRKMCQKCGCTGCDKLSCKASQSDTSIDELAIWESVKGEDYLTKKRQKEQENTTRKLQNNENRLLEISTHVTRIEQQVKEEMTAVKEQLKTMQSLLVATMTRLQSQPSRESNVEEAN
ncbi:transient receptor potential cation channel subfamily M member 2-like [Amphiura filiformis]|uniref:transient receptor potential cation channel subfamily M member 2-like n=1 Tax=Amphiura filiformis TaxID=82378 RepID=UPI003B212937